MFTPNRLALGVTTVFETVTVVAADVTTADRRSPKTTQKGWFALSSKVKLVHSFSRLNFRVPPVASGKISDEQLIQWDWMFVLRQPLSKIQGLCHRDRKVTYRAATLIWATVLLILSLQPSRPGNIHLGVAHRIAHFLGFGALALMATLGFGRPGRNSLQPAAACFLFGLAIEFLQHWQNQMPVEWPDVRDNAVGIGVFTAFCLVYQRKVAQKKAG